MRNLENLPIPLDLGSGYDSFMVKGYMFGVRIVLGFGINDHGNLNRQHKKKPTHINESTLFLSQ